MRQHDGSEVTLAADGRTWVRRALNWAGWCLLLVPVTILLHELGHLAAAMSLGFPDPALHFSSISHGDVSDRPAAQLGIVGLAGPIVTVLLAAAGAAAIALRPGARWPFALLLSAASRFVVGVPYTLVNAVLLLTGKRLNPPAFDEHKAATALGWPGDALLASTAAVLVAALVWVAIKLPRGERMAAWPGLLAGAAAGWAAWMGFVGPLLLP